MNSVNVVVVVDCCSVVFDSTGGEVDVDIDDNDDDDDIVVRCTLIVVSWSFDGLMKYCNGEAGCELLFALESSVRLMATRYSFLNSVVVVVPSDASSISAVIQIMNVRTTSAIKYTT